jgi:hypothetical protein
MARKCFFLFFYYSKPSTTRRHGNFAGVPYTITDITINVSSYLIILIILVIDFFDLFIFDFNISIFFTSWKKFRYLFTLFEFLGIINYIWFFLLYYIFSLFLKWFFFVGLTNFLFSVSFLKTSWCLSCFGKISGSF